MGDSQAWEALRKKEGKSPVPTFRELFAGAPAGPRQEAEYAASAVPAASALAIRRILTKFGHEDAGRRLEPRDRKQGEQLRVLCQRLTRDLETLVKFFDFPGPPSAIVATLDLVRERAKPSPSGRRGRGTLPHYRAALAGLRGYKIPADDARDMLRGVGAPVRPPDPN